VDQPIASKPPKKEYGKYDKYEIENCADTIIRAEEIKADKDKMKYVKPILEKKIAGAKRAIASIADLKAARDEMVVKKNEMESEEEEEDMKEEKEEA
jgi:ribosomal protein L17